jgi:hypothetical protein
VETPAIGVSLSFSTAMMAIKRRSRRAVEALARTSALAVP